MRFNAGLERQLPLVSAVGVHAPEVHVAAFQGRIDDTAIRGKANIGIGAGSEGDFLGRALAVGRSAAYLQWQVDAAICYRGRIPLLNKPHACRRAKSSRAVLCPYG